MNRRTLFVGSLHLLVLFGFAVAQPLFSLLSGYAEFFVARQSEPVDLILLVSVLSLGLPALLVLIDIVAGTLGPRVYEWTHASLVAVLAATIILQLLNRIPGVPGLLLILGAALLGVAASQAYVRLETVRTYLTFLSPVVVIFPGLFLMGSGISRVAFPEQVELQLGTTEATAPVVMIVFDEFPLASLLNEDRSIDPIRFPNLSRLAQDSYWFRNATSVSDSTLMSVPAILSGLTPQLDDPRIPTKADYPNTLFTLLGGSYRLEVVENGTQLSPEQQVEESLTQRMNNLLSDLAIVYAHMFLPSDMTSGLPPVDRSWNDFGSSTPAETETDLAGPQSLEDFIHDTDSRADRFKEFIDSIQPEPGPTLFFLHSMLPHMPWQYLPNGTMYSLVQPSPGLATADSGFGMYPKWTPDEPTVLRAYRRHLLQAAFVDTLIGELVDKLESTNLYDQSLIVITADHGVSFRPDDFVRKATETNLPDIMSVPLFIKTPLQDTGVVVDRNTETIDILPTLADALSIEIPWQTDGRSALDDSSPERPTKTLLAGRAQEFVVDGGSNVADEAVRRKLELFGSGAWDPLFAHGTYADLAGRQVDELRVSQNGGGLDVDGEAFFGSVETGSPFLLTNITGRIKPGRTGFESRHLAVAVNGRIQTVTELSVTDEEGGGEFTALVPETAFRPGNNSVEVFFVVGTGGGTRLERVSRESLPYYTLVGSPEEQTEEIRMSTGDSAPVVPGDVAGYARMTVNEETETVSVSGWAVDVAQPGQDVTVLVIQNQRAIHSGTPHIARTDVEEAYPDWVLSDPGFLFGLPLAAFDETEVRILALSPGGRASELNYIRDGWIFPFSSSAPD